MSDSNEPDRDRSGAIAATSITRRGFLTRTSLAAGGMITAAAAGAVQSAEDAEKTNTLLSLPNPQDLPNKGRPIKIFTCDFNWCVWDKSATNRKRVGATTSGWQSRIHGRDDSLHG